MGVVLWHIQVSHYNEKARWALDYKGIPYELRTPMPGAHRLTALGVTRGKHDRLPVIELDGRRIGDSTAIIEALEAYRPEPALYPADLADRRRALELEDHFDEELAPRIRRVMWFHSYDDPDALAEAIFGEGDSWQKSATRRTAPMAKRLLQRDYGIDAASAAEAERGVGAAMELLESELDQGDGTYLVGDSFSVADLTAAALFTPLLAPPERPWAPRNVQPYLQDLREELSARPGGQWVHEIFARHRGAAVPVA